DRQHLLLVWTVPGQTGRQGPDVAELWHTVQDRLSALPGVVSAGAVNGGVLTGYQLTPSYTSGEPMRVEGQPPQPTHLRGGRGLATLHFLETMGMALVARRELTERCAESAPHVVIINETRALFYFGDENAVGRFVRWSANDKGPSEIVGVVKDFVK